MATVKRETIEAARVANGIERRILARGGGLMAAEFVFDQGTTAAVHTHPHEQVGYVVRGRLALESGGQKEVLAAGDSYYIPPHTPHGVTALEATVILDVFTPQREDFLEE